MKKNLYIIALVFVAFAIASFKMVTVQDVASTASVQAVATSELSSNTDTDTEEEDDIKGTQEDEDQWN